MFKKYPSLTNHYQNKDIHYHEMKHGDEMKECDWILTEKIHGANISFLFQPYYPVRIFSRNQEVTNSNFYNSDDLFEEFSSNKLSDILLWCNNNKKTIRLFGELYGPGIQKGVDYGSQRNIKFFDMMVDDKFITQKEMEDFFFDAKLGTHLVPKLAILPTLQDALEYDSRFNSLLSKKEDNISEGFVIKPFNKVLIDGQGSIFYIKKKNDEFKEKSKVKKIRTETNYSEEVNKMRELFLSYINDNRVQSIFSKEGEINSHKDIGKYISLIHQDALEDFNKDYNEEENGGKFEEVFTKQERKYIMNSSKEVVSLLKTYL